MKKCIRLHTDELSLFWKKEIRGRNMEERQGNEHKEKDLVETQKQGIELWRKKVKMGRGGDGGVGWKRGREERGIKPCRC